MYFSTLGGIVKSNFKHNYLKQDFIIQGNGEASQHPGNAWHVICLLCDVMGSVYDWLLLCLLGSGP